MKTMNTKPLSVLLASLTLTSLILTACSNEQTQTKDTAETTTAAETAASETTAPGDVPEIPEADWDGEEFRVLYPNWSLYNDYYFADEENGEAVNDAIYKRTADIEELINIDFTQYTMGYVTETVPHLQQSVLAGDDVYDLHLTHNSTSFTLMVSEGLVQNWNDIPHIDMTKDYWNSEVSENMTIDGVLCFASNGFILPDINSIFYHKGMVESYGLEDVYTLVSNGEWTWDKLIEMAEKVSGDADGDGQMTAADRYGLMFENSWQTASLLPSIGEFLITQNSEGYPELSIYSEKSVGFVERIYDLITRGEYVYTWKYSKETDPNAGGKPPVAFDEGYGLFYITPLSLASKFRETELDFGIVPYPKYDENQEKYITLNWAGFMNVPMTASNIELIGMTVELLGYYNHEIVWPAFYDVLLGQKISRDEKSIEMLNIIFDDAVYDIGVALGFYLFTPEVLNGSGNFASHYESKINTLTDDLKKFVTAHTEYADNHTAK